MNFEILFCFFNKKRGLLVSKPLIQFLVTKPFIMKPDYPVVVDQGEVSFRVLASTLYGLA